MSEHDWAPIAPPEDNGIMCNVCLQCKCCNDWTDECPGEWVPEEDESFWKGPTERSRELVREWRDRKRADSPYGSVPLPRPRPANYIEREEN